MQDLDFEIALTSIAGSSRPQLASDLLVEPGQTPGTVRVSRESTGKSFELYDLEWQIAQLVDGTRSVSEIAAVLAQRGLTSDRKLVESFLRELTGYGFLEVSANRSAQSASQPSDSPEEHVLLDMAVSLSNRGDRSGAENYLLAILEINPRNSTALSLLDDIRSAGERSLLASDEVVGLNDISGVEEEIAEELAEPGADDGFDEIIALEKTEARRRILKLAAIAALVVAGAAATMSLVPWRITVSGDAVVEAGVKREIVAPFDAKIRAIHVQEGQRVEKGQLIAQLDTRSLEAELEELEAQLLQEEAELMRLERGFTREEIQKSQREVDIRKSRLKFAKKALNKAVRAGELISQAEIDELRKDVDIRKSELEQAKTDLSLLRAGTREEIIQIQKAKVQQVEIKIDKAKKRLRDAALEAPVSGTVVTPNLDTRVGTGIHFGEQVLAIGDTATMKVVMSLSESDLGDVRAGQEMSFWSQSLVEHRFQSEVNFVSSGSEGYSSRFVAYADVENPDNLLRPGMRGYATIVVGKGSLLGNLMRPVVQLLRQWGGRYF